MLHDIALQKSEESILLVNIGHLRSVVSELLHWDQVLNPVMPPSQISDKLKARLNQLLTEWKQQDAGELQKAEDLHQQSAPAALNLEVEGDQANADTTNEQSRLPDSVASQTQPLKHQSQNYNWRSNRPREDSVVDLLVRNTTQFVLYMTFSSPPDYVWPAPGRAFIAMPGESININLHGIAGQEIFLSATSPNDPYSHWGGESQPPVATCGESGLVRVLVQ